MSFAFRLSLGANIVLLGVAAVLLWRDRPLNAPPGGPPVQPPAARTELTLSDGAAGEVPAESSGARLNPTVLAQLERAGLSRDLVVSALLEGFHRRWDQRSAELDKKYSPKPVPEREYVELARERDAEQVRELKAALGEAGYRAWDQERTLRLVNSTGIPLSVGEADEIYRLQKEFDEEHRELQMAMEDGVADMADAGTLQAQAQAGLNRKLEQLLGRQRLEEMRGLSDPATEVYRRFGDLNPTPDQAKAVLAVDNTYSAREAALAAQLQASPGHPVNVASELETLNNAKEENLRRIFGADAYERMKRQNDPTYQALKRYAGAWELQEQQVQSVYEAVHAFHTRAERARTAAAMSEAAGQQVNWSEVNSAIEQARRQTETGLQTLIGDERLRRLKQNGMLAVR